jgi:hypothetical protein
MFAGAAAWLEKNAHDIDELNVFPVPDGDTGTNMLLTMLQHRTKLQFTLPSDGGENVHIWVVGQRNLDIH